MLQQSLRFSKDIRNVSRYRRELMAVAILGILFCHYNECRTLQELPSTTFSKLLSYLTCFVDVFLFLSAIGLIYSITKDGNWRNFYSKRAIRILPTYTIICLPYWIAYDCGKVAGGIMRALYDFFFISFIIDGISRYWFVFAIIILYLLFPLIYRFIMQFKSGAMGCLFCVAISIAGQALIIMICPNIYDNINLFIERIPIFILGASCGLACIKGKKLHLFHVICVVASALLFQVIIRFSLPGGVERYFRNYTKSLLGLVVIMIVCLILEQIENNCAGLWGKIKLFSSYLGSATLEIYIFHSLIKNVSGYPPEFGKYIFFAVVMPMVCGLIVHYLIESSIKKVTGSQK